MDSTGFHSRPGRPDRGRLDQVRQPAGGRQPRPDGDEPRLLDHRQQADRRLDRPDRRRIELFPGQSAFTTTITGFAGSYNIGTTGLDLSADQATLTVSDILQVTGHRVVASPTPSTTRRSTASPSTRPSWPRRGSPGSPPRSDGFKLDSGGFSPRPGRPQGLVPARQPGPGRRRRPLGDEPRLLDLGRQADRRRDRPDRRRRGPLPRPDRVHAPRSPISRARTHSPPGRSSLQAGGAALDGRRHPPRRRQRPGLQLQRDHQRPVVVRPEGRLGHPHLAPAPRALRPASSAFRFDQSGFTIGTGRPQGLDQRRAACSSSTAPT